MISEFDRKNIDALWNAISPFEEGYCDDTFAYAALETSDGFVVIQGSLSLNVTKQTKRDPFRSASVRAGYFHLAEIHLNRRQFVERLFSGTIPTPEGDMLFPGNDGRYGTWFQAFHPDGLKTQNRLGVLSIRGIDSAQQVDWSARDWELRSSPVLFDGIQDVLYEYQLGARRRGANSIDVIALPVALFDPESTIEGERAKLVVRAALSLPTEKVNVTYRSLQQGRVLERKLIEAARFSWSSSESAQIGRAEVDVPKGAVVHAVVRCGGAAQQFYWMINPAVSQNPRRVAYETFDPRLEVLQDIISRVRNIARGADARELEKVVAWLFWMLGFAPAHLGNMPKTQDAVDAILCTPNGHFVVIECTTGLLKSENKIPRLHDRAQALRRSLDDSNNRHLRILPVLVTTKTFEDIRPEQRAAEESGIYVITQETITQLIERTLTIPQPEQLYEQTEQALRAAQATYDAEQALTVTPDFPGLVQ